MRLKPHESLISQYSSVKEIYLLRQAGGAGDAGDAGGEKRLNPSVLAYISGLNTCSFYAYRDSYKGY
ncbi:hypothetical protein COO91_06224 [Nostoc flagelliforme CCNUN1]|uniref:Uncharacterized protein n=1 Tax=Nostoc flagelliforme CCNUN1 TaxID=2038116 RepID=A0A2K8SXP2_9NOSO|nr:hypothetical protein COO91_06224 [Nostoc flagelliforme CCNUN1]